MTGQFGACWVPEDQSWPVMGLFWCVGRREGHDEGGWLGLYTEACVKVVDPHILEFRQKKDNQRGPRERESRKSRKGQEGPGRTGRTGRTGSEPVIVAGLAGMRLVCDEGNERETVIGGEGERWSEEFGLPQPTCPSMLHSEDRECDNTHTRLPTQYSPHHSFFAADQWETRDARFHPPSMYRHRGFAPAA